MLKTSHKQSNVRKSLVANTATYAVLIAYTVFLLFPIAVLLITSVTPSEALATTPSFIWWPEKLSFEGYEMVFAGDFTKESFPGSTWYGVPYIIKGFVNTMAIVLIPLIVGLIFAGFSAFSYSKLKFPGKEKLFNLSFMITAVPLSAFGMISYIFYSNLGWTERGVEFLPLVVPGLFGSINTAFFLRSYFDGISNSMIEAAQIDGSSNFKIFFKIMLPLSKPAFIAQFIFGFVAGYNAYVTPLLYLVDNSSEFATLQIVLADMNGLFRNMGMENIRCAIAIVGMAPLIIIYMLCQKQFIEGIAVGGVKE